MPDFVKYHALGNDYLLVDPGDVDYAPTAESVRRLCDRHFGIGADGVLLGPLAAIEPERPVELRIFNSDGSACEKSGNGIRMFALYLAERYGTGSDVTVRTLAGDSPVHISDMAGGVVQVAMGQPSFAAESVPVRDLTGSALDWTLEVAGRSLPVSSLNNGNPHTVVFVDEVSRDLAVELGEAIAGHPRFPTRTNVQFVHVADRAAVHIEIWERGAGYTLASGASGCAAASAAHARGLVDDKVTVRMPGGELQIVIAPDGSVTMGGAIEQVCVGDLSPGLREGLGITDRARPALGRSA